MAQPTTVLATRFGVLVDISSPIEGPHKDTLKGRVHGREMTVAIPMADMQTSTRAPVLAEAASDMRTALAKPAEPDPETLQTAFQRYQDVVEGHDLEQKVQHLRFLYAADASAGPARLTLGLHLIQAIASELSYVLDEDYEQMTQQLLATLKNQ